MSALIQHRFTRYDFHRMAETGVFPPASRVELLDGKIIDMSPIGPFHGGVVKRLNRLFTQLSQGRWMVSIQDPATLDDYSEPQPDLMLLRPSPDDYTTRHPAARDIFLLIEVADTSVEIDRGEKLDAYARAGIPEVWIINLADEIIEVYRQPGTRAYAFKTVLSPGAQARPQAFPDVSVDLTPLFARHPGA